MKRHIITTLAAVVSMMALPSCSESFFDLYPTDKMTAENYMRNVEEIESVLNAAYGGMRGAFANGIVYIGELPTDNAYDYKLNNSTAHISLHESSVDSKNTVIADLWYACYQVINRCCLVIESMDALGRQDTEEYRRIVGQAKFLRGYTFYLMVRIWGDVPLVLEDIKDYMTIFSYGRSPVGTVYASIIDDLEDAAWMLPDTWPSKDKGRATSVAANAILGDVYLTRGDFPTAKTFFQKVISREGPELGLLDDYASIFTSSNANNREVIFAVQYAHNQTPSLSNYLGNASLGNIQGQYVDPEGHGLSRIYGVNILMMTHELEAKFSMRDKRRSVIYTGISSPDYDCTIPMTLKYFDYQNVADGKSGNPDSGCETIVSRYADVLLKYAECLVEENDLEGASYYLGRVRARAGLETEDGLDRESLRKAIADERQLELCMEGHRWFDLIRTGKAQEVMSDFYGRKNAPAGLHNTILQYEYGDSPVLDDYELVYPLPYAQVELNSELLVQNDKY